jgi:hypothetical protein
MKSVEHRVIAGNLIKLSAGKYLKVKTSSSYDSPYVDIGNESRGVLVERQGCDPGRKLECWSVLVNDHLLLAWQDQFAKTGNIND